MKEGEDYRLLRPTIAICFLDDLLFPGVGDYHTTFRLMEPDHGIVFTDDLQLHFLELPKFGKPVEGIATPLDGWLYFLRHASDLEYPALPKPLDKPEIRRAMEALKMFSQTDMEREIYEGRLKNLRDERAKLYDAETRGIERGMQRGLEQGLEQGERIGRIQALQDLLGQEPSSREELMAMGVEELERLAAGLRQELRR